VSASSEFFTQKLSPFHSCGVLLPGHARMKFSLLSCSLSVLGYEVLLAAHFNSFCKEMSKTLFQNGFVYAQCAQDWVHLLLLLHDLTYTHTPTHTHTPTPHTHTYTTHTHTHPHTHIPTPPHHLHSHKHQGPTPRSHGYHLPLGWGDDQPCGTVQGGKLHLQLCVSGPKLVLPYESMSWFAFLRCPGLFLLLMLGIGLPCHVGGFYNIQHSWSRKPR